MMMKVVVASEEEYNAWLESQEEFLADKPQENVAPESRAEATTEENKEPSTL